MIVIPLLSVRQIPDGPLTWTRTVSGSISGAPNKTANDWRAGSSAIGNSFETSKPCGIVRAIDPAVNPEMAWEVARLVTDAGYPAEAARLHR